jgi:chromate transport protein ChrA
VNAVTKLTLLASGLELMAAAVGFALGGFSGMVAALIGASIASAAQVAAVVMLRPAMKGSQGAFQQRWVLGMAARFASFVVLAALMIVLKNTLPPLWMASGYLGTLLVLLFAETQFLT